MEKKKKMASPELLGAINSPDPKEYVRFWISDNGLEYLRGGLWRYDGAIMRYDETRTKLLVDYQIDRSAATRRTAQLNEGMDEPTHRAPKKITKDVLFAAVDEVVRIIRHGKLIALRKKLAFDPQADPERKQLSTFVGNLTNTNVELSTAVMQHYVWMTKRRVFDKSVENHLIPVVIGGQGIGKSESVNRFLAPLREYQLNLADVGTLTDQRNYHAFSEYYVSVIDEMPRLQKTDMDKVKSHVTTPLLSSRTLGTHIFTSVPNNITIIGTSNTRLKYQNLDTTGMRRFYELIADGALSRVVSEGIDYEKLWKSVDENSQSPLNQYLPQLREHQEDLRPRNSIEQFFEAYHIDLSKPRKFKVSVEDGMYRSIRDWAETSGNTGNWLRNGTIKNMLEEQGLAQNIISGRKIYKVNEDCMLNPLYANGFSNEKLTDENVQEIESLPQLQQMLKEAVRKEDYFYAARLQGRMADIKRKLNNSNVFDL